MNRDTIIGSILIAAIFLGYVFYTSPSAEERAKMKRAQDSIAMVSQRKADTVTKAKAIVEQELQKVEPDKVENTVELTTSDKYKELQQAYGPFAGSVEDSNRFYTVETDLYKLKFSKLGGRIASVELKDYVTYDSLPLVLFQPESSIFGLQFFAQNRNINTNDLYFQPYVNGKPVDKSDIKISGDETAQFSLRLFADASDNALNKSKYIEYVYDIKGNNYMMDMDINFHNLDGVIDKRTDFINLDWKADLRRQDKTSGVQNGYSIYYNFDNDDVENITENKEGSEELKTKVRWVSFKQHFFSSVIVAKDAFLDGNVKSSLKKNPKSDRYLTTMETNLGIPYNDNSTFAMQMYFGPNKFSTLEQYNISLEKQVPIGWGFFLLAWINKYIVIPVFDWLGSYGWNYGIVILIMTILLKLVLFPVAYKTYLSSARMRVLKPEIDEINKKFPKQEDAMKKQQAMMALYKKAGVNPMAGCLPMLLQLPFLIAMFRFFPSSIELRQKAFLWAHDLSSYDSIFSFPDGFSIPFYGDHVSLFTLLMTISTLIYTRLNQKMMGQSNSMPGMNFIMYLMPIMLLFWFNSYASGLSYYYLLTNLITFFQMFMIRRFIDDDKIRLKIAANKKKPAKKSKFAQRLEEAAKKRGQYPRK
ncbi:MAG: membrane protein insertase YidC [Hyphomicrobiales bacterium]